MRQDNARYRLIEQAERLGVAPLVCRAQTRDYARQIEEELERLRQEGFVRVLINGKLRNLDEEIVLDKKSKHTIDVVVDRLVIKQGTERFTR